MREMGAGGAVTVTTGERAPPSPATKYKPFEKGSAPGFGLTAALPPAMSDDFYVDAALGALGSPLGADGRPLPSVTSTATVVFKRSRFAGHAAPVSSVEDVQFVVSSLAASQRCVPYAYRLATPVGGTAQSGAPGPETASSEGSDDGGDVGVGDKLLHLLKQWDVENVALAVTRDDSKSIVGGDHLGVRRFKIVIDCAKSVLELCYLDSLRRSLGASQGGVGGDEASGLVPSSAHGTALSAPPPPVPTGVMRRSKSGTAIPPAEDGPTSPQGPAAFGGSLDSKPSAVGSEGVKPTRPMGPDAPNMMFRPRGPMWKPTRTDVGAASRLPEGRQVDSCGIPLKKALGRVNNFRHGYDAQQASSPSKICAMRPYEQRGPGYGLRETHADDERSVSAFAALHHAPQLPTPPDLDSSLRSEIRAMRQPHFEVELALRCVAALVDGPRWVLRKHDPRTIHGDELELPYDVEWVDVRFALSEPDINRRVDGVDASRLPAGAARAVLSALVNAGLGPRAMDRLRIRSFVAAEFLPWLWTAVAVEIDPETLQLAISYLPKATTADVNDPNVAGSPRRPEERPAPPTKAKPPVPSHVVPGHHPHHAKQPTRDDSVSDIASWARDPSPQDSLSTMQMMTGKKLLPPDRPDAQNRVGPRIQADPDPVQQAL